MAITMLASPVLAADPQTVEPSADSTTTIETSNGDGRLSDDGLAAVGLLPVAEVTAEDLRDVSEADLSRLPDALRDRIQEPVTLESADMAGARSGFDERRA